MARPLKRRRICEMPRHCEFVPAADSDAAANGTVILTLDEFETIRLIDHLGLNQEECASQMDVARTTVQAVYSSARKKLAEMLVFGKRLEISGGHYELCGEQEGCAGHNSCCRRASCPRRRCGE